MPGLARRLRTLHLRSRSHQESKSFKVKCNYRVTLQVGDYILLTLIWLFRCLPYSTWAAANLAELTCHVGNMVELPNQSQQNVVSDLMVILLHFMTQLML